MNSILISRRSALAAATTACGLGLVGCGKGGSGTSAGSVGSGAAAADGKTYQIGVLQLTEHAALDAANKGFIKALDAAGLSYKADQQNAQNDQPTCQTIASKFVGDGVDLIFAIATPAAQAAAAATTEIPIVGCAITDFAASGLVESNDEPGGNVTGSSDLTPVADQIDLLHKVLPDAKKVGMLFCTAEANSEIQIKMAEEACDALGLEHERYTVSSSNEIQSVVESMVGKVDAGYSPTDNTIAAAAQQVGQIAKDGNLPFVCGEENMCMGMGICTISIDYEELGHMAGEMALKILTDGADPATMAIETESKDQLKVVKNEDMAKALGIDLSVLD